MPQNSSWRFSPNNGKMQWFERIVSSLLFVFCLFLMHISYQYILRSYMFETKSGGTHLVKTKSYSVTLAPLPKASSRYALLTINGWRLPNSKRKRHKTFQHIDARVNSVRVLGKSKSREFAKYVLLDHMKKMFNCILYADRDINHFFEEKAIKMCEGYPDGLYFTKNNSSHFILLVGNEPNINWLALKSQKNRERPWLTAKLMNSGLLSSPMCFRQFRNRLECIRDRLSIWHPIAIFSSVVADSFTMFTRINVRNKAGRTYQFLERLTICSIMVILGRGYVCWKKKKNWDSRCRIWIADEIIEKRNWKRTGNAEIHLWKMVFLVRTRGLLKSIIRHFLAGSLSSMIFRKCTKMGSQKLENILLFILSESKIIYQPLWKMKN